MCSKDLVLACGVPSHPVEEHGGEKPAGYLSRFSFAAQIRTPSESVFCILLAGAKGQGSCIPVNHDMDKVRGRKPFQTCGAGPHFISGQVKTGLENTGKIFPADDFKARFAPGQAKMLILH